MNDIDLVVAYHERSKHAPNHYAASLGYLDWASQPNPYRSYEGSKKLSLPLALDNDTPPYHLIDTPENNLSAPYCIEAISQFFQFSLGLAAYKRHGDQGWALRCNASSGNLQPSEAYLIAPSLHDEHNSVYHYGPEQHHLEILAEFESNFFTTLPNGSFLVALSSIAWREAWKYGERSFRYCQLDAGHALHALQVSAKILGWKTQMLEIPIEQLDRIVGFDQKTRFYTSEREDVDMLLLITPELANTIDFSTLLEALPTQYEGIVNKLSNQHHPWDVLNNINDITHTDLYKTKKYLDTPSVLREATKNAGDVVLKRRSAQVMDKYNATISYNEFTTILHAVKENLLMFENSVHLVLYVHSVEGLESGLYILVRNQEHLETLKSLMFSNFHWKPVEDNLYFLKAGDYRFSAKNISCSQDIASDGAFSLGMLTHFKQELDTYGPARYKELYWECGVIGQQLYLEATSIGLSATGIGCYLDDMMHSMLGLKDNTFQSLYHFTIGRGVVDTRLTMEKPYQLRQV